jgi:uncharacterized membrane protein YedE/YeeE
MFDFGLLISILIIVGAFMVGIIIIGFGELLLAAREIALNTRKESEEKTQYKSLKITAIIISCLGYFIIGIGAFIGIVGILAVLKPS